MKSYKVKKNFRVMFWETDIIFSWFYAMSAKGINNAKQLKKGKVNIHEHGIWDKKLGKSCFYRINLGKRNRILNTMYLMNQY